MDHVELMGLSGAGKSTYATILLDEGNIYSVDLAYNKTIVNYFVPIGESIIDAIVPPKVLQLLFRAVGPTAICIHTHVMKYPNHFKLSGEYLNEYTNDDDRVDYVASNIINLSDTFSTIERFGPNTGVLLIDEGFAHQAASIFRPPNRSKSFSEKHVKRYATSIPAPDELLYLRADPEICELRMRNRERPGGYPNSDRNKEKAIESLRFTAGCLDIVAEVLGERGTNVLEIDTDRSKDDVYSEIRKKSSIF